LPPQEQKGGRGLDGSCGGEEKALLSTAGADRGGKEPQIRRASRQGHGGAASELNNKNNKLHCRQPSPLIPRRGMPGEVHSAEGSGGGKSHIPSRRGGGGGKGESEGPTSA